MANISIKHLNKLDKEFWEDWWEFPSSNIQHATGGVDLDEGERAFTFKSGKNNVVVSNFMPRDVPENTSLRGISLRTTLDLLNNVAFDDDIWQHKEKGKLVSRTSAATTWAYKLDTHFKDLMVMQGNDFKKEVSSPDKPSVGEWVRFLGRAVRRDVTDSRLSKEDKEGAVEYVKEEIKRWQMLQRERGHQSFTDKMITKDISETMGFVYDVMGTENPIYPTNYNMSPTSKAVLELDEGRKDATGLEFSSAKYMALEDWENAFRTYNARAIFSRLWTAKATKSMPTAYPGRVTEVPGGFKKMMNGASKVAFKKSRKIPEEKTRVYVYSEIDDDGREGKQFTVDADVYEKFRLATNPTVKLPDGSVGRYKKCQRFKDTRSYIYIDENGKQHSFGPKEQTAIINKNDDSKNPDNPISMSVRGHIDDLFQKFFITATPEKYAERKPVEPEELNKLKENVHTNFLADYEPIWLGVVNEQDKDIKEEKIRVGMKTIMRGCDLDLRGKGDAEKLIDLQTDTTKEIEKIANQRVKQKALVTYLEKARGEPSPEYTNYSELNKYNYWKSEITQYAKTEAEKKHAMRQIFVEVKQKLDAKEIIQIDAAEVSKHFNQEILAELGFWARTITGEKKDIKLKNLGEAGKYVDPEIVTDFYKSKCSNYLNHYTPGKDLPYVTRKGGHNKVLTYSDAKEARAVVGAEHLITKVKDRTRTVETQKTEVPEEVIRNNTSLSKTGNIILSAIHDAKTMYDDGEDVVIYNDLSTLLEQRADGDTKSEEVSEMIGDITPEEAKIILNDVKGIKKDRAAPVIDR